MRSGLLRALFLLGGSKWLNCDCSDWLKLLDLIFDIRVSGVSLRSIEMVNTIQEQVLQLLDSVLDVGVELVNVV